MSKILKIGKFVGKNWEKFFKKNWPTLGLCRSLVLVFYCPDVNVIWGNRKKIYLFYILAHDLSDFFVYSQSHRQISQILLFWPSFGFLRRIVPNYILNVVYIATAVLFCFDKHIFGLSTNFCSV